MVTSAREYYFKGEELVAIGILKSIGTTDEEINHILN